jgi:peptidoglycan hydrolase-like protein with peptidoglycan-binding domain
MHSLMTGRDFTSRPIGRKAALWLTGAAALALISGQGPPVQAAEPAPEAGNSEAPTAAKSAYRSLALIGLLRNQVAAVETEIAMLETELDSLIAADPEPINGRLSPPAIATLRRELASLERHREQLQDQLSTLEGEAPPSEPAATQTVIPAARPHDERGPEAETTGAIQEVDYPPESRRRIQEALIYLGGYDSTVDGAFGERTRKAIRAFQQRLGAEPTGHLAEPEARALIEQAMLVERQYDVRPLEDDGLGFSVRYPRGLLTEDDRSSPGYRVLANREGSVTLQLVAVDDRGLDAVFADLSDHQGARYKRIFDDFFVASGEIETEMFYSMGRETEAGAVLFYLTYPAAERQLWDPFTVVLYNSFEVAAGD